MRLAAFLLLNVFVFGAWWLWLARRRGATVADGVVYAGLLMACQIVLTEILLGATGLLWLPWLLAVTLLTSGSLAAWALWHSPATTPQPSPVAVLRELRTPVNVLLLALIMTLTAWMLAATWLLPPRSVDDIAYHLPPLYQYVQTGRITLLPLELRFQFAMPLGGDFLFLWPLIFFHADTWVDGTQYVVALWGTVVLYALARQFDVPRRDAAFVSGLLLFTPVVISQSGSNYVEIITAVCHLTLIYAVVRFWRDGSLFQLVMAGLASGFGLGTKYLMLVAIAGVQPIILLRLWRLHDWRAAAVRYGAYLLALAILPAYWLVRNFLVTGYALFPYALSTSGLENIAGGARLDPRFAIEEGFGSALSHVFHRPGFMLGYFLQDPGLGTVNGGLGIVFWGAGLPALAYCGISAVRSAWRGEFLPALVWVQPFLFMLVFLQQIDLARIEFNVRLILVVVPFALLALGVFLRRLHEDSPGSASAMRLLCVGAAALVMAQVAGYRNPDLDLVAPLADRSRGQVTTPQRYYQTGAGALPTLGAAFEPLDYLTRDSAQWEVYMAADWRVFVTAPLFGSDLQNRVWNFRAKPEREPDAFVFHSMPGALNENLFYVGPRITPEQVQADGGYELVALSPPAELWVRRERLAEPQTRARLLAFYEKSFARDIRALQAVIGDMQGADVLVTSSRLGHALRYLSLKGHYPIKVVLSPPGREREQVRRLAVTRVITLDVPLGSARSEELLKIHTAEGPVAVISNELVAQ